MSHVKRKVYLFFDTWLYFCCYVTIKIYHHERCPKQKFGVAQKIILCWNKKFDVAQKVILFGQKCVDVARNSVFHVSKKKLMLHKKVFRVDKNKMMLHQNIFWPQNSYYFFWTARHSFLFKSNSIWYEKNKLNINRHCAIEKRVISNITNV